MSEDIASAAATGSQTHSRADSRRSVKRRARKACSHCHSRKIRCDVVERGVPCSGCIDAATECIIRRRKNQRADLAETNVAMSASTHVLDWHRASSLEASQQQIISPVDATPSYDPLQLDPSGLGAFPHVDVNNPSSWSPNHPEMYWQLPTAMQQLAEPASPFNNACDFTHLIELDNIMTLAPDVVIDTETIHELPPIHEAIRLDTPTAYSHTSAFPHPQMMFNEPRNPAAFAYHHRSMLSDPTEFDYLQNQRCFELPSRELLLHIFERYFLVVHPNLPIVNEAEFWTTWNGGKHSTGHVSLLLIRAMMFTTISYVDPDIITALAMGSKRDIRSIYYRRAKLIYDSGIEKDALTKAQACLLLSYHAPNHSNERINNGWLHNARRYARIARADTFYHCPDSARAKQLKRIWWGVIFRDRILSLGLRRSIDVHLCAPWSTDAYVLHEEDFESELGKSPVCDIATQQQLFKILTTTCRLMQALTPALQLVYQEERLDDRLERARVSWPSYVPAFRRALKGLHDWHEEAKRLFPFPVNLGNTHNAICIAASMMFFYYFSAVLALNLNLLLILECVPATKTIINANDIRRQLEDANADITRRSHELVSKEIVQFLPISAAALTILPILLQAINTTAAHNTSMQSTEDLRLEIFKRMLVKQRDNFDASDFCAEVVGRVLQYAIKDDKFVSSMTMHQDAPMSEGIDDRARNASYQSPKKTDWANLVHQQPRLLLRLCMYLDRALSIGGPPDEDEFPPELRRIPVRG